MANLLEQAIEIADIDVVMEVGLKDTDPDYSRESVMQVASVHEFPSHVVIETAMDVKESSVQVQAEKSQENDVQKEVEKEAFKDLDVENVAFDDQDVEKVNAIKGIEKDYKNMKDNQKIEANVDAMMDVMKEATEVIEIEDDVDAKEA